MRRAVVVIVLLGMFGGFAALLVLRERSPRPEPDVSPTASTTAGDAGAGAVAANPVPGSDADPDAPRAELASAEKTVDLERPIRTVGLGWDVLVPGVIANEGMVPGDGSLFSEAGLKAHFRAVDAMSDVESALALGGAENDGADIAIVSLPRLVASYEDLRALKPNMFFVVGWSRGRHALYGTRSANMLGLPSKGDVTIVGEKGEAETMLALFLLDLSGVDSKRVRILDPSAATVNAQTFAAVDRSESGDAERKQSRVLVTTADASGLIPYVAIAPEGFLSQHPQAVNAWARSWLAGVDTINKDVPGAARKVAAQKGAPDPLELLKQLGQTDFAGLTENARVTGLSGRGAVTLDTLFSLTWNLWRGAAVLTTPTPEAAPMSTATVTSLVLTKKQIPPSPRQPKPSFDTAVALRVKMSGKATDEPAVVRRIGTVAGVFGRSGFRVGVDRNTNRSKAVIAQASDRYNLPTVRFRAAPKIAKRRKATIEILAAP